MKAKSFYRVSNNTTQQGLWYDFNGNFTGLIHSKFDFCSNRNLLMPYDPNLIGWLSATESLEDLFYWFSEDDIIRLERYGYSISIYEAIEYKYFNNHWVIKQDSSILKECLSLTYTQWNPNRCPALKRSPMFALQSFCFIWQSKPVTIWWITINQQCPYSHD